MPAKGPRRAKVFQRAAALWELGRGKSGEAVAATLKLHRVSVLRRRDSYRRQRLKSLAEAPRSGRPIQSSGIQRAQITAPAVAGGESGGTRLWRPPLPHAGRKRSKKTRGSPIARKRGVWGRSTPTSSLLGNASWRCRHNPLILSTRWCVLRNALVSCLARRSSRRPSRAGPGGKNTLVM